MQQATEKTKTKRPPPIAVRDFKSKVNESEPAVASEVFENLRPDDLGLMTLEALAASFDVSVHTVQNWVARREIPFIRFNRRTMFNRDSIREWLLKKEWKPRGSR